MLAALNIIQNLYFDVYEILMTGQLDLTKHIIGYICLGIFLSSYVLVIFEEKLGLRKCKPVLMGAGIIWIFIAFVYNDTPHALSVSEALRHYLTEFAELFFFLIVAMTYINAMIYRNVFEGLKKKLIEKQLSYRKLFWITGLLAFFISPLIDNLTTSLILCAVVMAIGREKKEFIPISCINIVVAANAGGVFSPFGDLTTLMVWQKGVVHFSEFFQLFIPSMINFMVPAFFMQFAVPGGTPQVLENDQRGLEQGGWVIVALFSITIIITVVLHQYLHLPAFFGMMMGLTILAVYDYLLQQRKKPWMKLIRRLLKTSSDPSKFRIFDSIAKSEWDTLFFFYGVIMAVSGLGFIGYLESASIFMYEQLSPTIANIGVGVLSALIDNIPIMFSVLEMDPHMPLSQWLLVTLSSGVGGSLFSIGSAAGVAMMGQARGHYTFNVHLKWSPIIALGFGLSILTHLYLSGIL